MSPAMLARDVLNKYWNGAIPVNVEAIARNMGVQVVYRDNVDPGVPENDYSGSFCHVNGIPTCTIRGTDPYTRRRFTLAHELGHFVLGHQSGLRDNQESLSAYNRDPREIDANAFAAELLMPAEKLHYTVNYFPNMTLAEVARAFEVSELAMTYRLRNLGYNL